MTPKTKTAATSTVSLLPLAEEDGKMVPVKLSKSNEKGHRQLNFLESPLFGGPMHIGALQNPFQRGYSLYFRIFLYHLLKK